MTETKTDTKDQPKAAAPQTPGAQAAALATREQTAVAIADGINLVSIAGRGEVERIEQVVTIPADFQYAIPRNVKDPISGQWRKEQKVGLSADAYDYINRAMGVSFFLPDYVPDEHGENQRNPIHRKDYIYLRMAAVWYTPLGQLVTATEDIEVDYNLVWMDARINSQGAQVVVDDNGLPQFDAMGNPALKLSPEQELKALKTLSQLRSFGPRYAQTVARVRLLKMATGIRSLPIPSPADFKIKVVGFRDHMTPQQRISQVSSDSEALYGGRPADIQPMSQDELNEVASVAVDETEAIEAIDRSRLDDEAGLPDIPEQAAATPVGPTEGEQEKAPWAPSEE